jgi:iron(III) transport system ATP-binding protein
MISVRLEHIRKTFGSVVAVRDVSLEIEPGEIFFLLGPSGCGKTTLLRAVAGFGEPDGGRIFFGERDVTHLPPEKRNCGMVFQSYALWPHMTVAGNVGFGLDVRRVGRDERRRRILAALERVQLAHLAERKPNQLSGGQQQRVALARALVIEPDCLLLDEPLSNLDAKLRGEMRLEIRNLCKRGRLTPVREGILAPAQGAPAVEGLTAIYVTHDQKEALAIADRIAVLKDGDVQQVGTPEDLYRRPATRFVADFVGETNFIDGRVESQQQGVWTIRTALGALRGRCAAPLEAGRAVGPQPRQIAVGDPVTCSIRPESIRLHADGHGAPPETNRLTGTVIESVYLGDVAQHRIRCGQQTLRASELNPAGRARASDLPLAMNVAVDDVVVLP